MSAALITISSAAVRLMSPFTAPAADRLMLPSVVLIAILLLASMSIPPALALSLNASAPVPAEVRESCCAPPPETPRLRDCPLAVTVKLEVVVASRLKAAASKVICVTSTLPILIAPAPVGSMITLPVPLEERVRFWLSAVVMAPAPTKSKLFISSTVPSIVILPAFPSSSMVIDPVAASTLNSGRSMAKAFGA